MTQRSASEREQAARNLADTYWRACHQNPFSGYWGEDPPAPEWFYELVLKSEQQKDEIAGLRERIRELEGHLLLFQEKILERVFDVISAQNDWADSPDGERQNILLIITQFHKAIRSCPHE